MNYSEAAERVRDHMRIYHVKEPRAVRITEALKMGIELLERASWEKTEKKLPEEKTEVFACNIYEYLGKERRYYFVCRWVLRHKTEDGLEYEEPKKVWQSKESGEFTDCDAPDYWQYIIGPEN